MLERNKLPCSVQETSPFYTNIWLLVYILLADFRRRRKEALTFKNALAYYVFIGGILLFVHLPKANMSTEGCRLKLKLHSVACTVNILRLSFDNCHE